MGWASLVCFVLAFFCYLFAQGFNGEGPEAAMSGFRWLGAMLVFLIMGFGAACVKLGMWLGAWLKK